MKLKPGDTVRVVGSRGTAKIRAILTSMHGALLEKQIDGFRLWNPDESAARSNQGDLSLSIQAQVVFGSQPCLVSISTAQMNTWSPVPR
jgi:hypothetical protein